MCVCACVPGLGSGGSHLHFPLLHPSPHIYTERPKGCFASSHGRCVHVCVCLLSESLCVCVSCVIGRVRVRSML